MGQPCLVPKHEHSNLSPDFLDNIRATDGEEAELTYIRENSVWQGDRCLWLRNDGNGRTTCTAYSRRSKTCREYNDDGSSCPVLIRALGFNIRF